LGFLRRLSDGYPNPLEAIVALYGWKMQEAAFRDSLAFSTGMAVVGRIEAV
jgi:hypothetical protein